MLTDMTPTAGQLYGAQIPGMTMNVKSVSTPLMISSVKIAAFLKFFSFNQILKRLSFV